MEEPTIATDQARPCPKTAGGPDSRQTIHSSLRTQFRISDAERLSLSTLTVGAAILQGAPPASSTVTEKGTVVQVPPQITPATFPKPCAAFWKGGAGPYVRAKQFFAIVGAKVVSTSDPSTMHSMMAYDKPRGTYLYQTLTHLQSNANIDFLGTGVITVSFCKHTFTGPYVLNKDLSLDGKANVDPYLWANLLGFDASYHPALDVSDWGYASAFPDAGILFDHFASVSPNDGWNGGGDIDQESGVMPEAQTNPTVIAQYTEQGFAKVPFWVRIKGHACTKHKKPKPAYAFDIDSTMHASWRGNGGENGTGAHVRGHFTLSAMSGSPMLVRRGAYTGASAADSFTAGGAGALVHLSTDLTGYCGPHDSGHVEIVSTQDGEGHAYLMSGSGGKVLFLDAGIAPPMSAATEVLHCTSGGPDSRPVPMAWFPLFNGAHKDEVVVMAVGSLMNPQGIHGGYMIPLRAGMTKNEWDASYARTVQVGDKTITEDTTITVRKCSAFASADFC